MFRFICPRSAVWPEDLHLGVFGISVAAEAKGIEKWRVRGSRGPRLSSEAVTLKDRQRIQQRDCLGAAGAREVGQAWKLGHVWSPEPRDRR